MISRKLSMSVICVIIMFFIVQISHASGLIEGISAVLSKEIRLTWNEETFIPKESDGAIVYPIVYNGRTYLPARFIADKAGIHVGWDDKTKTVSFKQLSQNVQQEPYKDNGIIGEWKGVYSGSQGDTSVTIKVTKNELEKYVADFSFGPLDYNPNVATGRFYMDVDYNSETHAIKFIGAKWISNPKNYFMVNFIGSVSGDYINGAVVMENGKSTTGYFTIKKSH